MTSGFGLQTLDALMLAVLALSVVFGLLRGLVFELMSLLGWVAAYVAAKQYAPALAAWLSTHLAIGPSARHAVAFALAFVGALLLWALLSRLLRLLVHATPLRAVDRLLGGAFGALRAVVLLLAVATVVAMTPAVRSAAWQQSQGAAWLQALLHGIKPLMPGEIGRHLPS